MSELPSVSAQALKASEQRFLSTKRVFPCWTESLFVHVVIFAVLVILTQLNWFPARDAAGSGGAGRAGDGQALSGPINTIVCINPSPSEGRFSFMVPAPTPQRAANEPRLLPTPVRVVPLEAVNRLRRIVRDDAVRQVAHHSGESSVHTQNGQIEEARASAVGTGNRDEVAGSGTGAGLSAGIGGGSDNGSGTTSFLGMSDTAKRFVYVIDRSSSMADAGAFEAAKRELNSSLSKLDGTREFQVIFYNNEFFPLETRNRQVDLFRANDMQKRQVAEQIRNIQPRGGTRHVPALMAALKYRPDVIFLLTDGVEGFGMQQSELLQVLNLSRSHTRVHCFELGRAPRAVGHEENCLQVIARESGGQYVYRFLSQSK